MEVHPSGTCGCLIGASHLYLLSPPPAERVSTSWILCNHFLVPAPIFAAQVTGGLQEPFEIKEQHLKGHGRGPRGSACSSHGCTMCRLNAKPGTCWARRGIRVLGE